MPFRCRSSLCLIVAVAMLGACSRSSAPTKSGQSLDNVLTAESPAVLPKTASAKPVVADSNDTTSAASEFHELDQSGGIAKNLGRPTPPVIESQPSPIHLSTQSREILLSALQCQRARQAVIANNLANADTLGYKAQRLFVEDMAPVKVALPGRLDSSGNPAPVGVALGTGCRVAAIQTNFRQGPMQSTGRQLDLAIEGPGFLQVSDPDGTILYTRAGNLSLTVTGNLVAGSATTGRLIEPAITVPDNTVEISIDSEGSVQVQQPGQVQLSSIGQIQLAHFINPEGLRRCGENLFAETDASGPPTLDNPGSNGLGKLRQEMLEMSNVDDEFEMLQLQDSDRQIRRLRNLLGLTAVED